ncbi:hypothetical protein FOCC_FOCC015785 [Frankliniella occidentalis]|nr:hypothetical protein FOCC_FOCC015785 [Frankliniella occidentalis]
MMFLLYSDSKSNELDSNIKIQEVQGDPYAHLSRIRYLKEFASFIPHLISASPVREPLGMSGIVLVLLGLPVLAYCCAHCDWPSDDSFGRKAIVVELIDVVI